MSANLTACDYGEAISPGLAIFEDDYNHALIHLAWYREGQKRYLIFGMVELFPAEFPVPDASDEFSLPVKSFGERSCIYVRRFSVAAKDALYWYLECRNGNMIIPEAAGQLPNIKLITCGLAEEPTWPHLITTNDLPFHCWGAVRAHHLVQEVVPEEVSKLFASAGKNAETIINWLKDRLFFDLQHYQEWKGSLHLIAPNPVFRSFHQRLGVSADGSESSDCHLELRAGRDLTALDLYLSERHQTGIVSFCRKEITSPFFSIPHIDRTEQVEYMINSSRYGVLDWHEPVSFIRSIQFQSNIVNGKKIVNIPDSRSESYEVQQLSSASTGIVGDKESGSSISAHLRKHDVLRKRRKESERLGQKWFHGNQEEATIFVRQLIMNAQRRVFIVDPYFATVELFSFALATSRSEIEVVILTAAEDNLMNSDRADVTREAGEVLYSQVQAYGQNGKIKVFVMTGDPPPVHDRFLVVDNEVWLSGNSLHTIGKRAGMMIKLPYPDEVARNLENLLTSGRVKPLEQWVMDRRVTKQGIETPSEGSSE